MRARSIVTFISTYLLVNCCLATTRPPDRDTDPYIEEVSIVGSRARARQIAGAATYLGFEHLDRFSYTDIQRILRSVPGISLQTEDGFGLRPNISIRGVATERSSRITLLEDSILIAPAPYAAPAAYYFPTPGRIHGIEILKGPAAITQGPYTVGGALNMISTPVTDHDQFNLVMETGTDETFRTHTFINRRLSDQTQFLLETHQWRSEGFQHFSKSNQPTGLNIQDYMLKYRHQSVDGRHQFILKLQQTRQHSNQSYLGLTDPDFERSPLRRYDISALDNIHSSHRQEMIQYRFFQSESNTLQLTIYRNRLARNWFKTHGIDLDGSTANRDFSGLSWNRIISAVNLGQSVNGTSPSFLAGVLNGTFDSAEGSIQLRANSRTYLSRGIQAKWETVFNTQSSQHNLELGFRVHEDNEDRLQRNSTYHQVSHTLVLDDPGRWGNAGNQLQSARAFAFHLHDNIKISNLTLAPGIRFEYIQQQRQRWETRPDKTLNPSSRHIDNRRDQRRHQTKIWLPGMAVLYQLNESTNLIAGIHKGFSAAGNAPQAKEELSVNYEMGIRLNSGFEAEAIFFLSDYDNILGLCTASSGSQCTTGDIFNGDAATVQGLEFSASIQLEVTSSFNVPISVSYTWIDSQFDSDIADTAFFGNVSNGDPIPYIPTHQLQLSTGLAGLRWSHFVNLDYQKGVCVRASCSSFEKTESTTTVDFTSQFELNGHAQIFLKVENALNVQHIVSRQPYGARPNRNRSTTVGFKVSF